MTDQHDGHPRRDRGYSPARTPATGTAQPWPSQRQGRQNAPGRRSSLGMVGLALAAAAGVAAIGLIDAQMRDTGRRTRTGPNRRTAAGHEPEVERSITIEDVPADELYRRWRDPETLRR